jgi:hypothetical protein
MARHKSYCYLEFDLDEDDQTSPLLSVWDDSILDYEVQNIGIPECWWVPLSHHPKGFYEIEYSWGTSGEYCDGYKISEYAELEDLIHLKPSRKAHLSHVMTYSIRPKLNWILSLFQKNWCIEYCYGSAGTRKTGLYLPEAIWKRLFTSGADSWGGKPKISIKNEYN